MNDQNEINYHRIAEAIEYIKQNFKLQPSLEEIAAHVHVSPFHFQRLFTEWAGTSPKKFLQYISLGHAKQLLRKNKQTSLFDATFETGLSTTSRLHDLFVNIEGMTPAEYKNGGKDLVINYSFEQSPFGNIIIAATHKGICFIAFCDEPEHGLAELQSKFPNASLEHKASSVQQNAVSIFHQDWSKIPELKLHLKGTDFQLKVWEALLKIPLGQLCTYGDIAEKIDNTKASRAVGTAIGSNPVAFLIPCHRVIQATGIFGGYMWGNTRKTAMIGWEMAQTETPE